MKNLFLFSTFMLLAMCQSYAQNTTVDCNDAQAIKSYLEKNGFESSPITIIQNAERVEDSMMKDFAQLVILRDGQNVNLAEALQKDVKAGASEGFSVVATVTKNENFCDQSIRQIIYNDFDKGKYDTSINAHVWDNPNSTDDLLFIRYNPVVLNK